MKKEREPEKKQKATSGLDWEAEREEFFGDGKSAIEVLDAEAEKDREREKMKAEIRRSNRGDVEDDLTPRMSPEKKKKANREDLRSRKIASTVATIVSLIATIIVYLLLFYVFQDGDLGKIIVLGLFILLPMELIAIVCAIIAFISNIIMMFAGKFSWIVLFNFLFSFALLIASGLAFFLGAEALEALFAG